MNTLLFTKIFYVDRFAPSAEKSCCYYKIGYLFPTSVGSGFTCIVRLHPCSFRCFC